MDDKETKVPIYIAIMVALILVAAGGYFILGAPSDETPGNGEMTPTATPTATQATTTTPSGPAATATPSQAQVSTVKCELCHTDPQNLNPHVNGGRLCINCHGSQVHNIHIGAGTVNLQCDTCHGFPPKIPTVQQGEGPGSYSVCERCHAAPPNSLEPSNGNLIVVHLSRAKYCTNCHGTDIGAIHAAALANASRT